MGAGPQLSQARQGPLPCEPSTGPGTIIPGLLAPTSITQGQVGRAWTTRAGAGRSSHGAGVLQERRRQRKQSLQPVFGPRAPRREEASWGRRGQAGHRSCSGHGAQGSSGSQEGLYTWMFFVPGSLASDPSITLRSWAEAWSGGRKWPCAPCIPASPRSLRATLRWGCGPGTSVPPQEGPT